MIKKIIILSTLIVIQACAFTAKTGFIPYTSEKYAIRTNSKTIEVFKDKPKRKHIEIGYLESGSPRGSVNTIISSIKTQAANRGADAIYGIGVDTITLNQGFISGQSNWNRNSGRGSISGFSGDFRTKEVKAIAIRWAD